LSPVKPQPGSDLGAELRLAAGMAGPSSTNGGTHNWEAHPAQVARFRRDIAILYAPGRALAVLPTMARLFARSTLGCRWNEAPLPDNVVVPLAHVRRLLPRKQALLQAPRAALVAADPTARGAQSS